MSDNNQAPEPTTVTIDVEVLKRLVEYSWRQYAETVSPGQWQYLSYIPARSIYNDIRLAHVAMGLASLCPTCGHPEGSNGHSLMGDDFEAAIKACEYKSPLPEKIQQVKKGGLWGIFK